MNELKAVQIIVESLGINHSTAPALGMFAFGDIYGYSSYKIEELQEYMKDEDFKYLCQSLMTSWILKSDPPTKFTLGIMNDNSFPPVLVKNPFTNVPFRSSYKWYGLQAIPCDLIKTRPNRAYVEATYGLYKKMCNTYNQVVRSLILLPCTSALEVYSDSYRELQMCFE